MKHLILYTAMVLALLLGGADNTYAIFNKVKTPDY